MNTKIVSIVVGVIVVVAAAFLIMKGKSTTNNEVASTSTPAANKSQASVEANSLKGLLASGSSRKCTFDDTEQGVASQGTVYVSNGKFRGDFSATVSGKAMMSHMFADGQTSYVWTDGMNAGYKMKFDAGDRAKANANAESRSVDPNKNLNFHCDSWSGDSAMFNLPSGVQFSDMSSMMGGAAEGSSGAKADICASLSEPAKTQCMAALKK